VYDPDTYWNGSYYWYPANLGNRFSSEWVGLDGMTSSDVVQDGIEMDVLSFQSSSQYWVYVSSYYAWVEWYPGASVMISNFSVTASDFIYAYALVGNNNPCGAININANTACFHISRVRNGVAIQVATSLAKPAGTTFVGDSAEFILERPTVGGSLYGLPDFQYATMYNVSATSPTGGGHNLGTDPTFQFNMINNSSTLLSDGGQTDATSLYFHWDATQ
jgi:hypothetical protein